MLTPDQLMAVSDPTSHIIIEGDYGCGKTYVLKERTKQCADKFPDSKIAYINFTIDPSVGLAKKNRSNMMDLIAEQNFSKYSNVDVVTSEDIMDYYSKNKDGLKDVSKLFQYSGEECSLVFKHFLKNTEYDHVFIDEMPVFKKESVEENDLFSRNRTYCVTMKYDVYNRNKNDDWIKQMKERYNAMKISLNNNMRNSKTIVNVSTCFDQKTFENLIKPSAKLNKNLTGPACYYYHNIHKLDQSNLAKAAIMKYFPCITESVLVLTDNIRDGKTQSIYDKLKKYFLSDRKTVYLPFRKNHLHYSRHIRKVKEYLKHPEGIFITDSHSFNGAQARNIIIIANNNRKTYNMPYTSIRNMIMRTMSFAVIIHYEDMEILVPGLVRDENLHEYIDPGNTDQLFCYNIEGKHRSTCNLSRLKVETFRLYSSSASASKRYMEMEKDIGKAQRRKLKEWKEVQNSLSSVSGA